MKQLLLYFFPILSVQLFAQTDEPLRFERIEGLSQNTVYSILKDKQGFMWIATANGLNRFDGVEMKTFKPALGQTKGVMKGRIIRSGLIEDDDEQIWFGTDMTVNCYNKKKQVFLPVKLYLDKAVTGGVDQTPNNEFFANPLMKKNNTLWFANAADGLFSLNTITNKSSDYPVPFNEKNGSRIPLMYNGVYDEKDKLWFASRSGLLCFDINKHLWNIFLKDQSFFSLSVCRDTIYLGGGSNFVWFDIKSARSGVVKKDNSRPGVKEGLIRRIITDDKNNIWAGDQEGNIYYKAAVNNEFVWRGNINENAGTGTNYPVYCLYTDTTGNLWVGADVLGLLKAEIKPGVFKHFPDANIEEPGKSLFIHSIYEDEKNNTWLGTFQKGLFLFNPSARTTEPVKFPYYDPKLPYARSVPFVGKDSLGNMWTSYSGYLYVKEKGANDFKPLKFPVPPNSLQSPQLWHVTVYKEGWLLSTNIGLFTAVKKNNQYNLKFEKDYGLSRVVQTWISPQGKVWIVRENAGVAIADDLTHLDRNTLLFSDINVKSLQYEEDRKLLWLSTSDGLIAYDLQTARYRVYSEKDGLLSGYIYGILLSNDIIWASTNHGLSKGIRSFQKDSLFPEIRFTNYTSSEGLPVNEFNTGAFHKGKSGTFYFGSTKGVVWFKPEDIKTMINVPALQLTKFLVNEEIPDEGVAAEYISSVTLPYNKNNLFFQFRGIDFNNSSTVRYKYRLEGWDKDWINSNTLNEVRYNNLPNGQYTFKIIAAGASGEWSREARSVSVTILAPFWKTWWFYALIVLLIAGMIVLLTRRLAQRKLRKQLAELEKQREIDKERIRISREMHDDIGAGLTQITLMSESVKNKLGTGNKELEDIGGTSRKLVSNMSEIIWSLNPENKTLDQLCSYLREQLNKQLEYSAMEYSIHLPENNENIVLSNEQRRNLLLVTKEIVNNAIKYSKASTINIKGDYQNGKLAFEITDNGIGFDSAKSYSGNGLRNMKQRMNELGGGLTIQSGTGQGSIFSYYLPLK